MRRSQVMSPGGPGWQPPPGIRHGSYCPRAWVTYPSASAAKASLRLALPDTRWWPAGAPAPPLCSPSPSSKFTYRFWPAGALPPKHLALPLIDDAQPLAPLHDEVLPALPQDFPEDAPPLALPEDQYKVEEYEEDPYAALHRLFWSRTSSEADFPEHAQPLVPPEDQCKVELHEEDPDEALADLLEHAQPLVPPEDQRKVELHEEDPDEALADLLEHAQPLVPEVELHEEDPDEAYAALLQGLLEAAALPELLEHAHPLAPPGLQPPPALQPPLLHDLPPAVLPEPLEELPIAAALPEPLEYAHPLALPRLLPEPLEELPIAATLEDSASLVFKPAGSNVHIITYNKYMSLQALHGLNKGCEDEPPLRPPGIFTRRTKVKRAQKKLPNRMECVTCKQPAWLYKQEEHWCTICEEDMNDLEQSATCEEDLYGLEQPLPRDMYWCEYCGERVCTICQGLICAA